MKTKSIESICDICKEHNKHASNKYNQVTYCTVNRNGQHHSFRDRPSMEYGSGDKMWHKNDKTHRVNGPAIEYAHGGKFWYKNGKHHRLDGPAVEYKSGKKYWWLNDVAYSEKDWAREVLKRKK